MKSWIKNHMDFILYAFFGVLTTVVNIIIFAVSSGAGLSTAVSNIIAWIVAVLFAYVTNRKWVFKSQNHTINAILKEFTSFILCRLGTGVIDQIIMVLGVDFVGPKMFEGKSLYTWGLFLKVFSNIIVILLNYVFSKFVIFKKTC